MYSCVMYGLEWNVEWENAEWVSGFTSGGCIQLWNGILSCKYTIMCSFINPWKLPEDKEGRLWNAIFWKDILDASIS